MSEDTQFWAALLITIIGGILVLLWLVEHITIGAVGLIPLIVGKITLFKLLKKKKNKTERKNG